ncbi:MAG: hypothetical protein D6674_04830 [Acidobacteria bacterium]|jgi:hypothetical protein|nr:MAG: hypothetical protein D6674_04830 [Acidobacteriota bacterium]
MEKVARVLFSLSYVSFLFLSLISLVVSILMALAALGVYMEYRELSDVKNMKIDYKQVKEVMNEDEDFKGSTQAIQEKGSYAKPNVSTEEKIIQEIAKILRSKGVLISESQLNAYLSQLMVKIEEPNVRESFLDGLKEVINSTNASELDNAIQTYTTLFISKYEGNKNEASSKREEILMFVGVSVSAFFSTVMLAMALALFSIERNTRRMAESRV